MSRRDPGIDAVRAVAIAGVVLGHWLVTAVVLGADGALRAQSPLAAVPALRPASWLFQTLGLFFLAAGFAAVRSRGPRRPSGGRPRGYARLLVAVAGLLVPVAAALAVGAALDVPAATLATVGKLVVGPLWFLLPYLVLAALARPIAAVVRRVGPVPPVAAGTAVVALADLGVGTLPLTLCAAWLVPYALGVALAVGRLGGRRTAVALLAGGAAAVVVLVLLAGYPDSAVGVPGAGRSNLNPPSLAAVALAVAQTGAAVLALPWLRRRTSRPVAAVNRRATAIYLWHQPALVAVTVMAAWLAGGRPLTGLLTPPDGRWVLARVAWIAGALALVAATVWLVRTVRAPAPAAAHRPRLPVAGARPRYDLPRFASPARPTEVIAVRDSDPPSRSRAVAQPR